MLRYDASEGYPYWDNAVNALSQANVSALINKLGVGSATAVSNPNDYIITQYVNGGTSNTTYYRRKISNVVKGVLGYSQSGTNFPVQMSSGDKLFVSVPSATANPIKVGTRVVTAGNTVTFSEGAHITLSL